MERRADGIRRRHRVDEPRREVARMRGDEAEAPEPRQRGERGEEIGEVLPRLRIPVRVDRLPEELDLHDALGEEPLRLLDDVPQPPAPLASARPRDDAESAVLVAPL